MSKDLDLPFGSEVPGLLGRNTAVARQLRKEEILLAARTKLSIEKVIARDLVTETVINSTVLIGQSAVRGAEQCPAITAQLQDVLKMHGIANLGTIAEQ